MFKKVSITIVGDSCSNDYSFGGVLNIPHDFDCDQFPALYKEYMGTEPESDFTDWLIAKFGWIEDEDVGFVCVTPDDLE